MDDHQQMKLQECPDCTSTPVEFQVQVQQHHHDFFSPPPTPPLTPPPSPRLEMLWMKVRQLIIKRDQFLDHQKIVHLQQHARSTAAEHAVGRLPTKIHSPEVQ